MKKTNGLLPLIIFLLAGFSFAQDSYTVGANYSLLLPNGMLANRYSAGSGFSFFAGQETSPNWTWTGKFEYIHFGNENTDELFIKRKVTISGVEREAKIGIPELQMELTAYGVSANVEHRLLHNGLLEAGISLGFGVYRWQNLRGQYYDSVYVDTSGNGDLKFVDYVAVPENKQQDWSGGFDAGIEFSVFPLNNLEIFASGSYKVIVGELWPALALDKDNVSTFQMYELRAGLKYALRF